MPEFVDKNANILAVVDGNDDQVQPAGGKRVLQCRHQLRGCRDTPAAGAIGGGVKFEQPKDRLAQKPPSPDLG